jgi:type IV secretory pathway VirB10-like protein
MKDELRALTRYAVFVGLMTICLGGGLLWLLAPDPSHNPQPKPVVIPQKFLDSIERKKPIPVQVAATADAAKPVMLEAPASLTPSVPLQRQIVQELTPPKRKAKRPVSPARPSISASAPTSLVTTGRTDFPY